MSFILLFSNFLKQIKAKRKMWQTLLYEESKLTKQMLCHEHEKEVVGYSFFNSKTRSICI